VRRAGPPEDGRRKPLPVEIRLHDAHHTAAIVLLLLG
jgi:hypothetical protein